MVVIKKPLSIPRWRRVPSFSKVHSAANCRRQQRHKIFGYSRAPRSLVMANLASGRPPSQTELSFTLIGNPNSPNGGVAAQIPGDLLSKLGRDGHRGHSAIMPGKICTIMRRRRPRYHSALCRPSTPLPAPTLRALQRFILTPEQIDLASSADQYGQSHDDPVLHRSHENLRLLEPLRSVPIVGTHWRTGSANLKVINPGRRPAYGYSTSPPQSTPFGVVPRGQPGRHRRSAGTHRRFACVSHLELPLPADGSTMPTPHRLGRQSPLSIDSLIDDLQVANRNLANTISRRPRRATRRYSQPPTSPMRHVDDRAVLQHPPLEGIKQALKGDDGLVSAVGYRRGRRGAVHGRRRSSALDHHQRRPNDCQ